MPRGSKKPKQIDVSQFDDLVEEALKAFGSDVSYAVTISRQATSILKKRRISAVRKYVRTTIEGSKNQLTVDDVIEKVEDYFTPDHVSDLDLNKIITKELHGKS